MCFYFSHNLAHGHGLSPTMSGPPYTIDNEDPLLFFDPLESATDFGSTSTSMSVDTDESNLEMGKGKGKALSQPVPILLPGERGFNVLGDHDTSFSPPWSASSSYDEPPETPVVGSSSPSSPTFTLGSFTSVWQHSSPDSGDALLVGTSPGWKGKAKASSAEDDCNSPPSIPPLTFTPMNTAFDQAPPPSGISLTSPLLDNVHESQPGPSTPNLPNTSQPVALRTNPSIAQLKSARRHSFSHPRTRTLSAASSMSKLKLKLGASSTNTFTRKLLSKKGVEASGISADHVPASISQPLAIGSGSSNLSYDQALIADPAALQVLLKVKGRSYSSPYPISILDIIPPTSQDVFLPIPIPSSPPRNHFDEKLPRELKLKVLWSLVELYEIEHQTAIDNSQWTSLKASSSKNRWVGKDKAISYLIRLSRVRRQFLVPPPAIIEGFD